MDQPIRLRNELEEDARSVLARQGYSAAHVEFVGAGEQSACYASGDVAVLLSRADAVTQPDLTGHVIPCDDETIWRNGYPVLQWITGRAADAGVRTPRILAVGDDPRPYALIERAHGMLASAHPDVSGRAVAWFWRLGAEVRKTNLISTTGFGMFTTDSSGAHVGRYPTWPDFLEHWLRVYLCVGQFRSEDARTLDLLLGQGVVTERDLASVVAKVREAQSWPVCSVLTHYDNRLDNLVVDRETVTVLDWDLSCAGIGIAQEMIKLFESGAMSMSNPRVAAFLHGYGLSDGECQKAIDDGKFMLVLDGLAMSRGWAEQPHRHDAVRGWLRTVKTISSTW